MRAMHKHMGPPCRCASACTRDAVVRSMEQWPPALQCRIGRQRL